MDVKDHGLRIDFTNTNLTKVSLDEVNETIFIFEHGFHGFHGLIFFCG